MKWLINSRSVCESLGGGALEAKLRLRSVKDNSNAEQSIILIKQPFWSPSVLVLVYDPASRSKGKIVIEVYESSNAEFVNTKPVNISLSEAYLDTGIFIGSVSINGSHSTAVKARYTPINDKAPIETEPIFMAFH